MHDAPDLRIYEPPSTPAEDMDRPGCVASLAMLVLGVPWVVGVVTLVLWLV